MTLLDTGASVTGLMDMLTYKRPAGSKTERRFIREFIHPLGVDTDAMGNLYKRIGRAPVVWSCHTDTVHRDGGTQAISVAAGRVVLAKTSQSNCLGADDTAGVWLLTEMIKANRPGLYIFHRAEEIGGVGSSHIASKTPNLLTGMDCAIALDRRGTTDIITHQAGGRCCSDAFAGALARALGTGYAPDSGGLFTDTANYTGLIGECTNVSVGYYSEHSAREALDIEHVLKLRQALLAIDTESLPIERTPGEPDPDDYGDAFGFIDPYDQSARGEWTMTDLVKTTPMKWRTCWKRTAWTLIA